MRGLEQRIEKAEFLHQFIMDKLEQLVADTEAPSAGDGLIDFAIREAAREILTAVLVAEEHAP